MYLNVTHLHMCLDPPKYYVKYFPENMTDVLKNCEEDANTKIFDFEF